MHPRFTVRAVAVVLCAGVLTSCSTTILDTINTTTTSSVVTTTTIPTGDIPELLGQLLENTQGLGSAIVAKDKAVTAEKLRNVESIWVALKPQLLELPNDLATDVERIVNLVRSAVNKKRPADADKALRFVSLIVDAGS
ncbi:MAG: hypothetical protein RJB57_55 [Actinomycetota bacterium]